MWGQWGGGGGGGGVVFLSTTPGPHMGDEHEGQFYLWSPLMKFSLAMAIVVGVILLCLLLYSLFYFCMYGTCWCSGFGCFWCPQPAAAPPCDDDEPVKVRIRRPSRSDSCRSSVRSERSGCSYQSAYAEPQPLIIQTVPAIQSAPSVLQAPPVIQSAPVYQYQSAPVYQYQPAPVVAAPPPPPVYNREPSELRVVIGSARQESAPSSSGNVIVYDMGGRGNAGFERDF